MSRFHSDHESDDDCRRCKFWRESYGEDGTGECHRFPPQHPAPKSLLWALSEINWFVAKEQETANAVEFDAEGQKAETNDMSLWPSSYDHDWCGEFQPVQDKGEG